jgi:subtilisin family serine protease
MKNVLILLLLMLVSCVGGDPQPIADSKTIPGAATDSVNTAIPDQPFVFREQDYSTDHPELPGIKMSFNTMYLIFKLGVTVAQANEIIKSIDAEIVGGRPGVSDKVEGVLLLRTPTTTHPQMMAMIQQLKANPKVKVAVPHHQYDSVNFYEPKTQPRVVSTPHAGIPFDWQWELSPLNGNWGLEFSRVPQMWAFNAAIGKKGISTVVGVLDGGTSDHEDVQFLVNGGVNENQDPSHGLHVSGIIGATFNSKNNSVGIDGINPYAKLISQKNTLDFCQDLIKMIQDFPNLQVINMSLGQSWNLRKPAINPNTNLAAQQLIFNEGLVFLTSINQLRANGKKIPIIVTSAGNSSGFDLDGDDIVSESEKNILTKWNSALTYASIVFEDPNILIVEAINDKNTRAAFSNIGGQISAPGVDITSAVNIKGKSDYKSFSGTSMAAPHVTGLVSYLLALDPDLDTAQIRKLLLENSIETLGGSSPHMDAFSSAMDIDRLRDNDAVLRKLLDIDDGTADGNLRLMIGAEDATSTDANNDGLDDAYLTSDKPLKILATPFIGEDANNDKGIGDGKVTMSDFRRWRDWLIEADSNPGNLFTNLNGENDHPKKDLNGDGKILNGTRVEIAVSENVYANGDFNGDGKINETATRAVSGNFGKAEKTDLEVFQRLFNDPHYKADDLPSLISSSDITVSPKTCFAVPGVTSVRSSVRRQGTDKILALERRNHESKASLEIYTVSIGVVGPNYTVLIEALNAAGEVVASVEKDLIVGTELFAGSDTLMDGCDSSIGTLNVTITHNYSDTIGIKGIYDDPFSERYGLLYESVRNEIESEVQHLTYVMTSRTESAIGFRLTHTDYQFTYLRNNLSKWSGSNYRCFAVEVKDISSRSGSGSLDSPQISTTEGAFFRKSNDGRFLLNLGLARTPTLETGQYTSSEIYEVPDADFCANKSNTNSGEGIFEISLTDRLYSPQLNTDLTQNQGSQSFVLDFGSAPKPAEGFVITGKITDRYVFEVTWNLSPSKP